MKLKDKRGEQRSGSQNQGSPADIHPSDNRQFKENTNFPLFNCGMELIFFYMVASVVCISYNVNCGLHGH